jgi:hypothetical protein
LVETARSRGREKAAEEVRVLGLSPRISGVRLCGARSCGRQKVAEEVRVLKGVSPSARL